MIQSFLQQCGKNISIHLLKCINFRTLDAIKLVCDLCESICCNVINCAFMKIFFVLWKGHFINMFMFRCLSLNIFQKMFLKEIKKKKTIKKNEYVQYCFQRVSYITKNCWPHRKTQGDRTDLIHEHNFMLSGFQCVNLCVCVWVAVSDVRCDQMYVSSSTQSFTVVHAYCNWVSGSPLLAIQQPVGKWKALATTPGSVWCSMFPSLQEYKCVCVQKRKDERRKMKGRVGESRCWSG